MSVPGFVSRAACRGRRPSQFASHVACERPSLVAQLLKSRDVARFIVAPSGYGKTFLAVEYAETMHSWAHVFWFNAQSPCFVRDLDAGTMAMSCFTFDEEAALIVFDDVPLLDDGRQKEFSSEIDKFLAKGCEVIVTCPPACNLVGSLQRDRICLRARDLLLDDAELDALRDPEERLRLPASKVGAARRVPLLAWSSSDDRDALFVEGAFREEVPSDLLLVMCSALVLHRGSLADLVSIGPLGDSMVEGLAQDYPHTGLEPGSSRFEAAHIKPKALVAPLKRCLSRLVQRSSFDSSDGLVEAWASIMLENGQTSRACAVMDEACSRRRRVKWVVDHAVELTRRACFFPALKLLADGEKASGGMRAKGEVFEALCRRVLGDEEGAVRCAKHNAFDAGLPDDVRVLSLLVVARLDSGVSVERAREELDAIARREEAPGGLSQWALLAEAWRARMRGASDLSRWWLRLEESEADEDVLSVGASWLYGLLEDSGEGADSDVILACRHAEGFVRSRLNACESYADVNYFVVSAALSMEEAHRRGVAFDGGQLDAPSLVLLRQVEMGVLSQRRRFEEERKLEQARRSDWVITHPSSLLAGEALSGPAAARSVPILSLRMFGLFEVAIGDKPVEYSLFKRQNTRALLVLLAVNQGRELSREAVAEAMWPQSSHAVAHKNFYTVWSHLRRALSLPDGTCPYLVRHRYGCSLDTRFVQSDIDRLNEICRELLFSSPNIERWSLLFAEIDRDFSSDLMPAERKNALITQARNDYRARLVDALVAATVGAVDADNPQWGVWFARAAIARDETREDAYVALMRAQIAGNQRTAAMMTYLSCRRALSNQLGIDPSPETTALYESLLDGE